MKKNQQFSPLSCLRGICLTTCAAISLVSSAEIISPTQALKIAQQQVVVTRQDKQKMHALAARDKARKRLPKGQSVSAAATSPYYLFNDARGRGFVLVAGDDAMGEILAYSDQQPLDTLQENPGLHYFLRAYRERFAQLQRDGGEGDANAAHVQRGSSRASSKMKVSAKSKLAAVPPMMATIWGQGVPFNLLTPKMNHTIPATPYRPSQTIQVNPPTGCVATAVSQIMAYHQWPKKGLGSKTYTSRTHRLSLSADFSQSVYNWPAMKSRYSDRDVSSASAQAVAQLMSDVGIACEMDYSPGNSGALSIKAEEALSRYFKYHSAFIRPEAYGNDYFLRTLYEEIRNGYPFYLAGRQEGLNAGHAWVVDGYDKKGLFHMNFGWDGSSNGYYSIHAIAPSSTGAEFGGEKVNFNAGLEAILAHPNRDGKNTLPIDLQRQSYDLEVDPSAVFHLAEGQANSSQKTVPLSLEFDGLVSQARDFEGKLGVVIYDVHKQQVGEPIWNDHEFTLPSQRIYPDVTKFSLDLSKLSDGRYAIAVVAQPKEAANTAKFYTVRQLPAMDISISGNEVQVLTQFSPNGSFLWEGNPTPTAELLPGTSAELHCPIRSLSGESRVGKLTLSVLNEAREVVYTAQSSNRAVVTELFSSCVVRVPITLPTDFQPGRYSLRAQVELSDENGQSEAGKVDVFTVENQLPTIEVKAPQAEPLMVEGYSFDHTTIYYEYGYSQLPFINVELSRNDAKLWEGRLRMYFEDVETGLRVPLNAEFPREKYTMNGDKLVCSSDAFSLDDLPVVKDRRYYPIVVLEYADGVQENVLFRLVSQRIITTQTFSSGYDYSSIDPIYRPETSHFFRIQLPTNDTFLADPFVFSDNNEPLVTLPQADDVQDNADLRTIFYQEGDQIISLATGQPLKGVPELSDWRNALQLAAHGEGGGFFKWLQQEGKLRLRLGERLANPLSIPLTTERVTRIPINMPAHGYATFFTPVQGKLVEGKAYRATLASKSELQLHEISGEIPANTAFIVENKNKKRAYFQVSEDNAPKVAAFTSDDNVLFGYILPPGRNTNLNIYGLSTDALAFQRINTWQRPFRGFVLISKTKASNIERFSVKLPIPLSVSPLRPSETSDESNGWDISGRRITTPQRGQIMILPDGRKLMR